MAFMLQSPLDPSVFNLKMTIGLLSFQRCSFQWATMEDRSKKQRATISEVLRESSKPLEDLNHLYSNVQDE